MNLSRSRLLPTLLLGWLSSVLLLLLLLHLLLEHLLLRGGQAPRLKRCQVLWRDLATHRHVHPREVVHLRVLRHRRRHRRLLLGCLLGMLGELLLLGLGLGLGLGLLSELLLLSQLLLGLRHGSHMRVVHLLLLWGKRLLLLLLLLWLWWWLLLLAHHLLLLLYLLHLRMLHLNLRLRVLRALLNGARRHW